MAEEYDYKIRNKDKIRPEWPIKAPEHMEWYEEDELARVLKELISIDKDLESLK